MSNIDEEYENDPRTPCQYGAACYRRNEDHLQKFKHKSAACAKEEERKNTSAKKGTSSLKQQKLNLFFTKNSNTSKNITEQSTNGPENTNDTTVSDDFSKVIEEKENESLASKSDIRTYSRFRFKEKQSSSVNHVLSAAGSSIDAVRTEISREDCDKIIKELFYVKMPEDFYCLWEFCKKLSPARPEDALRDIELSLVGPYDVLSNKLNNSVDKTSVLRHWRYFYDPPEFQTIIKKDNDSNGFHIGYYRDQPEELPSFVGSNNAHKDPLLTQLGENVFAALDWYLKQSEKSSNPFKKVKSNNIKSELHSWAQKHNFVLEKSSQDMRTREKNVVSRTFHNAGIVVPYDKKTELGYRPLSETPNNLRKLLKQIDDSETEETRMVHFSKLHEIVTWANIAMDEGDHGTCLELGIDLFCFGSPLLHKLTIQLLTSAYELLGRQPFATIVKAHLQDRKRGDNLSILSNCN